MAHRHKAQKGHGKPHDPKKEPYNAQGSHVEKEAEEKKRGGKVVGRKSGGRLDRRARGGRTGANNHPFSSAKIHEKGNLT